MSTDAYLLADAGVAERRRRCAGTDSVAAEFAGALSGADGGLRGAVDTVPSWCAVTPEVSR